MNSDISMRTTQTQHHILILRTSNTPTQQRPHRRRIKNKRRNSRSIDSIPIQIMPQRRIPFMLLKLTNTTTTRIINTKVLVVAMDNLVSVVDGGIVAVVGDKRAAGV